MNDLIRWAVKLLATGILWVFILSINIEGRSLFSYGHEILVQNPLVELLDEELSDLWDDAKDAVGRMAKDDKEEERF